MIDYTQWPTWALIIVVIAREFKPQLANLIPESLRFWAARRADDQEHDQELEEVLVNHELQEKAAKQLREVHHEDVLTEMVVTKDEWIQGKLTDEIAALRQSNGVLIEKVTANTAALTAMNGNLVQLNELIQKLPTPPGWLRR
jgi:hypothetical protein